MRQVHRNDQDKYEVGEKIRLARKKKKMSQGDLMDVMDTDRETISRYENGNREMTICTLFQFVEALEIDPRELMPGRLCRKEKQTAAAERLHEIAGMLSEEDLEMIVSFAEWRLNQKGK